MNGSLESMKKENKIESWKLLLEPEKECKMIIKRNRKNQKNASNILLGLSVGKKSERRDGNWRKRKNHTSFYYHSPLSKLGDTY